MKKLIVACILGALFGQAMALETIPTRPKCLIKPSSCR